MHWSEGDSEWASAIRSINRLRRSCGILTVWILAKVCKVVEYEEAGKENISV